MQTAPRLIVFSLGLFVASCSEGGRIADLAHVVSKLEEAQRESAQQSAQDRQHIAGRPERSRDTVFVTLASDVETTKRRVAELSADSLKAARDVRTDVSRLGEFVAHTSTDNERLTSRVETLARAVDTMQDEQRRARGLSVGR